MGQGEHASEDRGPRLWVILVACAAALAVAAGGLVVFVHVRDTPASASPTEPPPGPHGGLHRADRKRVWPPVRRSPCSSPPTSRPTRPCPRSTRRVAGSWAVLSPSLLQYQATGPLVPGASETLTVPGGPSGVIGSRGSAHGQDGHLVVHRGARLDAAPPGAPGRARVPSALVHAGRAADLADPGGQRPARHVLVALAQPAQLR